MHGSLQTEIQSVFGSLRVRLHARVPEGMSAHVSAVCKVLDRSFHSALQASQNPSVSQMRHLQPVSGFISVRVDQ